MSEKKIVRLAIIREQDEKPCPYGLYIPDACMIAGNLVDNMTAVNDIDDADKLSDDDKKNIIDANNRVLMLSDEPKKNCKYANSIFLSKDKEQEAKVECSFGDTGAGVGAANFNSTPPLCSYLGISMYSIPLGFYNQDLSYSYTDGSLAFSNRYFASLKFDNISKKGKDKK